MQESIDSFIEPPKLGHQPDGSYITPYIVTVFHTTESMLGFALGALLKDAQSAPICETTTITSAARACEYVSPSAILLAKDMPAQGPIDELRVLGFDKVYILCATEEAFDTKLVNVERVLYSELYDYFELDQGFASIYVVELLFSAESSGYKSKIEEVTHSRGVCFTVGVRCARSPIARIKELGTSILGQIEIDKEIVRGQTISEMRESLALHTIERGIHFNHKCGLSLSAVLVNEGYEEVLALIPAHPVYKKLKISHAVVYSPVSLGGYVKWFLAVVRVDENAIGAIKLLESLAIQPGEGDNLKTSVIVNTRDLRKIVSFLDVTE